MERSWAARGLSETFDDFSGDSDLWIYAGDAYRDSDNEYVVLTENKNDQAGVVWFKAGVEAPFVAEFKYKAGGGSGADGLVFMFNKQFETYSAHRGGSLGFWGSGYGVEFDNYLDAHNSDPSANHIALVKDGTDNHLIAVNDRRTEDNKWHDVKVSVETSGATIFVDDEEVLNWSEKTNCTYDRIGFSAATGGANNWHMIDDVKIRSFLNLNENDYRFVIEPRSALQGIETELRVTANLPALEERGEEAVEMGDPIHWYITTPSGQEIEGEKDTFHESKAGGPSDVATYDFPEVGEYVVRIELPESGLERAWTVYAHPQPEIDDGSNETLDANLTETESDTVIIETQFPLYDWDSDQIVGSVDMKLSGPKTITTDKVAYYTIELSKNGSGFIVLPSEFLVAYDDANVFMPTQPYVDLYDFLGLDEGWYCPSDREYNQEMLSALGKDVASLIRLSIPFSETSKTYFEHIRGDEEIPEKLIPPDVFLNEDEFDIVSIVAGGSPIFPDSVTKSKVRFSLAFQEPEE